MDREFVEMREFVVNGWRVVSVVVELRKNGVDGVVVVVREVVKSGIRGVRGRKRIVVVGWRCRKVIESVWWVECVVEIGDEKRGFIVRMRG